MDGKKKVMQQLQKKKLPQSPYRIREGTEQTPFVYRGLIFRYIGARGFCQKSGGFCCCIKSLGSMGGTGIAIATWWLIFDGIIYMLLRVVFSYTKWAPFKTSEISPG